MTQVCEEASCPPCSEKCPMNDEDVSRIVDAYTMEPVIVAPFGTMTGQSTPEGSKALYSDYTMPYEGETLHILGLGWGHGMLFIHTEEYGTTGVRFPYEMTKPVVCDEDDGESDCQECVKKTTQTNLEYWGYAR